MKPINPLASACRYCRHYQPEGRRGGNCSQLSAPVQGCWKACSLAVPAFAPTWESLEESWNLPLTKPMLPILSVSGHLDTRTDNLQVAEVQEIRSIEETTFSALPSSR
ncbi:hypothetical protein [Cylindrospermopsis raciborskii]|uniref:Uncharacterized protein n=1 Tax=Cylindrospermopsis raciborskii CENA302 TaxID=1170768 RepID=A0A9Q5W8H3_9CYAN|nr:hypothetical protein [Cylindrospermopsis raciborskii]MCZ2201576.1 hypothetical protein [Cylindrospermopsis raciborskii PAMP2012]MCZ2204566.1 hypothetical protein [Cylindrospermopsis raciborskii PAMP2011]NLQ04037.1 hypothetical protein [Cylindrospermopsis raciborskii MVCC19]OHY31772.1 hypothetical protein BCV64_14815 [Cylindrospermopsis raciborskii MVCC14]OPH09162.1 hypothetical protein CENA302_12445 [Cylindrospermopsis raciborskii CENA302]